MTRRRQRKKGRNSKREKEATFCLTQKRSTDSFILLLPFFSSLLGVTLSLPLHIFTTLSPLFCLFCHLQTLLEGIRKVCVSRFCITHTGSKRRWEIRIKREWKSKQQQVIQSKTWRIVDTQTVTVKSKTRIGHRQRSALCVETLSLCYSSFDHLTTFCIMKSLYCRFKTRTTEEAEESRNVTELTLSIWRLLSSRLDKKRKRERYSV